MSRIALKSLAAGLALLGVASAVAVEWNDLGPAPIRTGPFAGRVPAIAISPVNGDLWFAGGCDSGVWRSSDAGLTWTALTDHMPTTSIGALAIDPQNPTTIYAGTGEANFANHSRYGLGLYKSTDNGDTWVHLGAGTFSGRCFSTLIVSPNNSQQLFAGITRAGGFPEMSAAKGHPQRNGPVGVFRSDDGGMTWTHLSNGIPNQSVTDLVQDPQNPLILYAAVGHIFGDPDNGIYKTTDGGNSWTKLTNGLPSTNVGRISIAIAPSNPLRLYAMITRACDAAGDNAQTLGGWRTIDGGATWTAMPNFTNIQATYGWYLSVVHVHPTDANLVWFGGLSTRRTTDGGNTFQTGNPPHVDVHAFAWTPDGENLVMGCDGGVFVRPRNGLFWTPRNEGLGVCQFYAGLSAHPVDSEMFLGGTQDNGTNRRTADEQWRQGLGGDGGWTLFHPEFTSVAFAELQGSGNLYRSGDQGLTFGLSSNGINPADRNCFQPPYAVDPAVPTRMLYATHRVYESNNTGITWTPISGDVTAGEGAIRALAIAPSNSQVVYVATNDGRVLRSDDGGANLTLLLDDHPGWPRTTREIWIHLEEPYTVLLAASAFGVDQITRSTDGGETWTSLDGDLPDIPVNVVVADVRLSRWVIYAGTDHGLYRSTDDGQTWRRYGVGLPGVPVIDLVLETDRGRLLAATQGRGLWSVPVGLLGDMNCNGVTSVGDIGAFVLAVTDPAAYNALYPDCLIENGDIDGNTAVTPGDIGGFVDLLTND
jgi:photosystem II stability/assembly factor-like uncharacterized protein